MSFQAVFNSRANLLLLTALIAQSLGCARIETGEVGLRRTFTGEVRTDELNVGLHQTLVGDVIRFSAKETLISIDNMQPQTLDKTTLKDIDLNFMYSVTPTSIGELYVKYGNSAHLYDANTGELYPMANYVIPFVRAALYSCVAKFQALDVNDNRVKIEQEIMSDVREMLSKEGLGEQIRIAQVNIRNIQIAEALVESANNVVRAQNDLKTKQTEVQIAEAEARRIQALSRQTDEKYVRLLQAQATLKQADALYEISKKAPSYMVVPANFSGMINIK